MDKIFATVGICLSSIIVLTGWVKIYKAFRTGIRSLLDPEFARSVETRAFHTLVIAVVVGVGLTIASFYIGVWINKAWLS
jgi:hypothetical protein